MAITTDDLLVVRVVGAQDEDPRLTVDQQFPPGQNMRMTVSELGALIDGQGPFTLPPTVTIDDIIVVSSSGPGPLAGPRMTANEQFPPGRTTRISIAELAALRAADAPVTVPGNVQSSDFVLVRIDEGNPSSQGRLIADEQIRPGQNTVMTVGNLIALINQEFPLFATDDKAIQYDPGEKMTANPVALDMTTDPNKLTVWMGVKPEASATFTSRIFEFGTGLSEVLFSITAEGVGLRASLGTPTRVGRRALTGLTIGVWHSVALTYDRPNLKIFIDGVEVGVDFNTNGAPVRGNPSDQFAIGATFLNAGDLEARIHSTAVWDGVLTPAELLVLHNGGDFGNIDFLADSGDYVSSDVCRQWFRHGLDGDLSGQQVSGAIDMAVFTALDASDIVTDLPS